MGFAIPPAGRGVSRTDRFQLVLPSDLARVGDAVEAVVTCCAARADVGGRTRFRLCTIVAEAVANAMSYGNGNDPARHVTVDVEVRADAIVIGVSDEGEGFDPESVAAPDGPACHEATRGRGLFMIRQLAAEVSFNARGNTIWMTLPRR